jgi:hypothetical protein
MYYYLGAVLERVTVVLRYRYKVSTFIVGIKVVPR